jgi:hypothetical protein
VLATSNGGESHRRLSVLTLRILICKYVERHF